MIASLIYQCVPVPCDSQRSLERNRSVSHAARGRNRCQKCRERGYYYLHRHLNNPLFHTSSLFIIHYSLFISVALSLWRWSSNASGTDPSAFYFVKRWGPVPRCSELLWPLILVQIGAAISTATTTGIDHQARSLSRHREAT